jgi:nucleotide-binding universal stress UspA family protein
LDLPRYGTMATTFNAGLNLRRVLFATDFSPSAQAALPQAAHLAWISGARLYLTHVIEIPPRKNSTEAALRRHIDAIRRLDDTLALPELRGISTQTVVGNGRVNDEILRIAQEYAADLVVTGTRSRNVLSHFFANSTAKQLAESAPCPVLTVGPRARRVAVDAPIRNIVLATSLNPGAAAGISYARSFAQAHGAKLWVAHSLLRHSPPSETDSANRWLRNLVPDQPGVERVAEVGSMEQVTVTLAERECADLVMLAPGLGSWLPQIARQVNCPVMAVRYAIPMIHPKSLRAKLTGSQK